MKFNLKGKCLESKDREFFYGAKINKEIKDVYMGLGFLEPRESGRKQGPGRGHEELIYSIDGQIEVEASNEIFILNEGDVFFIPEGNKIKINNLMDTKVYFIIAGGHTKHHKH